MKYLSLSNQAIALILLTFVSINSHAAADGKRYTGAFCQSHSDDLLYHQNGRVSSSSFSEKIRVACPILKDVTFGQQMTRVKMWVQDQNPAQDFRCVFRTLRSATADGWFWWDSETSLGANANPQELLFASLPILVSVGHAGIFCEIPAQSSTLSGAVNAGKSAIVSYTVDEVNP